MKRAVKLAIAALLFITPPAAVSGTRNVELPSYKKHVLKNGLEVLIMETREVPLVTVHLLVPAGSAHDTGGREGIASLTAELLLKGAGGLGAEEISERVEGVGGLLDVYTGYDYTAVMAGFMSRDLTVALDILSKAVIAPDFPAEELVHEKEIFQARIRRTRERPDLLATQEFVRKLAVGHPYSHPVSGSLESISGIARNDVIQFHRTHYIPAGSILAVVGDIDGKEAYNDVKRKFGVWDSGFGGNPAAGELGQGRFSGVTAIIIDKPDATQSNIRIGNVAVKMNTPDYFPLLIANNVLGGGFTSRLMDEIRVDRGLSYRVRSRIDQMRYGGFFGVYTSTKNETLRETIDIVMAEIEKLRTEMVSGEELEISKRYISGRFPFDLETNNDLAWWLTELSFFGFDDDFVERYCDNIESVSPEDVLRVAREYFHTDNCLVVVLTNYEETRDQLEGLGDIKVIGINEIR